MAQTETNRTITAGGKSGATGPYNCNTSPTVTVVVKKGGKFPNAPSETSTQDQIATWTLVNS
jgi:hypothetical protein